jgi:hypothetical protein
MPGAKCAGHALVSVFTFTSPYKTALRLRNEFFPLVQDLVRGETLDSKGGTQ